MRDDRALRRAAQHDGAWLFRFAGLSAVGKECGGRARGQPLVGRHEPQVQAPVTAVEATGRSPVSGWTATEEGRELRPDTALDLRPNTLGVARIGGARPAVMHADVRAGDGGVGLDRHAGRRASHCPSRTIGLRDRDHGEGDDRKHSEYPAHPISPVNACRNEQPQPTGEPRGRTSRDGPPYERTLSRKDASWVVGQDAV